VMNGKMKDCFTPHAIMHSLIGFGLGLLVGAIFAQMLWLGIIAVVIVIVGTAWDMMRKDMPASTPPTTPPSAS
jgi:hypothetical protein